MLFTENFHLGRWCFQTVDVFGTVANVKVLLDARSEGFFARVWFHFARNWTMNNNQKTKA